MPVAGSKQRIRSGSFIAGRGRARAELRKAMVAASFEICMMKFSVTDGVVEAFRKQDVSCCVRWFLESASLVAR